MSDPFDDVTPIGSRTGEPTSGAEELREDRRGGQLLSAQERSNRRRVNAANRGAGSGHEPLSDLDKRHRDRERQHRPTRRHFTSDELLGKVTRLGRLFYDIADDPSEKPIARKYAVTSFSTLVDKWTIVSARPPQQHDFTGSEPQREPLRELGSVIAGSRRSA